MNIYNIYIFTHTYIHIDIGPPLMLYGARLD